MRWPIEVRLGGGPPAPLAQLSPERPSTTIGFFSDLSRNPKQAFTFVMTIGGIMFIATLCIIGVFLAVYFAAKGTKGVPPHYILPIGISGASLLTLVTTLTATWIRRLAKASRADAASDRTQDGKS